MIRGLVLYIAYKACGDRDIIFGKHSFQLRNAQHLISVNLIFHLAEVCLLILGKKSYAIASNVGIIYPALIVFALSVMFATELLFPKRLLAKAVTQYKNSRITSWSRWIAFGYL